MLVFGLPVLDPSGSLRQVAASVVARRTGKSCGGAMAMENTTAWWLNVVTAWWLNVVDMVG